MSANNKVPPDNPLTVARERIQASAREIIRNIENVMGNNNSTPATESSEGSLEQAFRSFFTSCTTGATMATTDEDDNTAAGATPVSTQPSQDSSLSSKSRRLSMHTVQRAAVSTKESLRRLTEKHMESNKIPRNYLPPTQPHAADHVYEHLFFEEEPARDVPLRIPEELPRNRRQRSPQGASPNTQPKKRLTKPFPVSSPQRDKPVVTTPCTAEGIAIPQCPTFDDGISAISSHTLEAMAREPPPRSHSVENEKRCIVRVTPHSFPRATSSPAAASNLPQAREAQARTPREFEQARDVVSNARESFARSPGSYSPPAVPRDTSQLNVSSVNSSFSYSKNSTGRPTTPVRHGTPQSRSTRTSQSSGKSFENWQSAEKKFWESVAQDESTNDGTRKKKKRSSRRRTTNSTFSTASSTAPSRSSSWLDKHPHETISYERSDLFFNPTFPETDADTAEI